MGPSECETKFSSGLCESTILLSYSADTDQAAYFAASDLDLHCLPTSYKMLGDYGFDSKVAIVKQ